MNAPDPLWRPPDPACAGPPAAPRLHQLALAALADALPTGAEGDEADALRHLAAGMPAGARRRQLASWWQQPPPGDARLHALAAALGLDAADTVAVALALAVECDALAGRLLAWLQAPLGGARPTLGLLASLAPVLGWTGGDPGADDDDAGAVIARLVGGRALACGLLQLDTEPRPLPERAVQLPLPLALALRAGPGGAPGDAGSADLAGRADSGVAAAGTAALWPGHRWLAAPAALPPSIQAAVRRQAQALQAAPDGAVLVLRSGHPREARDAAAAVAAALGCRALALPPAPPPGLGPWLGLQGALPVLLADLAPGELLRLAPLPGWRGPVLVATGLDGQVETEGDPAASWTVPLPLPAERAALWGASVAPAVAERLGRQHRHSAAQIDHLRRAALHLAQLEGAVADAVTGAHAPLTEARVHQAQRAGGAGNLGTLAQWLPEDVDDAALVAPPPLREALAALRQRCQRRDGLADALGPAARTRYRPGVRALLVGASGTGKTLAAGWLATQLGLPLVRVDAAAVASKYIGETEKNLAQLFARAEQAEVLLLFDEADALFGKRTDVKDANDRFANQQTNYLLQRIESFDGITLLTSNSRSRFDSAFTRRLDAIIDFPAPGPEERRALWRAHLGAHHALDLAAVNRIAASCDLAGGHVRNATLAAAAMAPGPIAYAALRAAIEAEYRKLGRPPPAGL